jgi:hypothetical protein
VLTAETRRAVLEGLVKQRRLFGIAWAAERGMRPAPAMLEKGFL